MTTRGLVSSVRVASRRLPRVTQSRKRAGRRTMVTVVIAAAIVQARRMLPAAGRRSGGGSTVSASASASQPLPAETEKGMFGSEELETATANTAAFSPQAPGAPAPVGGSAGSRPPPAARHESTHICAPHETAATAPGTCRAGGTFAAGACGGGCCVLSCCTCGGWNLRH